MTAIVEHELLHETSGDVIPTLEAELILRRRRALEMFLQDPEEAVKAFPDLLDSLGIFLTYSTNPFANSSDSRVATTGSEQLFDEWDKAVAWFAEKYLKSGKEDPAIGVE